MTIYIDVVLFENIAMNYIILMACSLIENRKANFLKIFISSTVGGIYSILNYVIKETIFINILLKILISIIMVKIAFKSRKFKTFFKQLMCFYVVSFMIGGVAFMIVFLMNQNNVMYKDGMLIGTASIKIALLGGVLGFSIITIISNIQKRKIENQICDIEIFYKNKNIRLSSFIDTGNLLKDPITNQDVVIVEKDSLKTLFDSSFLEDILNVVKGKTISNGNDYIKNRIKLIPFSSLGNENGLLVGFKSDYIKVYDEDVKLLKNVVIGIYDGKLTKTNLYTSLIGLNILKEGNISDRFIANT